MVLVETAVLVGAGAVFGGAAVAAATRWAGPGTDLFGVTTATTAAGAAGLAAATALSAGPPVSVAVAVAAGLALPVPWLLFALAYTGRDGLVTRRVAAAAAAAPALGLAATATVLGVRLLPSASLPARNAAGGLVAVGVAALGAVQWVALLVAGGLVLAGTGALLWTFERYEHLDPAVGTLLGVAGTVPWLALLVGVRVAGAAPLALARTAAAGLAVGAVATVALARRGPFAAVAAAGSVGPRTVVRELDDAVVVTGADGTVVEVNGAAEAALSAAPAAVVGAPVGTAVGHALSALRERDTVALRTDTGRRLFEPTVSALTDQHGTPVGHAVVLRDVTARTTRRQRLSVLNRVLRHNLRNEASVVVGNAERLRTAVEDADLRERAEAVIDAAETLTELSATAREVDGLVADADPEPVAVAPLVRSAADAVAADHPAATVEVDVPEDVVLSAPPSLLETALEQLVENAVVHGDRATPWAAVRADRDPDVDYPLALSVLDDGPGIPDAERDTVLRGEESPLAHGSGIGLWVARWTATLLGGELSFGDRDPRGSVVTLGLPAGRLDPPADAEPSPVSAED